MVQNVSRSDTSRQTPQVPGGNGQRCVEKHCVSQPQSLALAAAREGIAGEIEVAVHYTLSVGESENTEEMKNCSFFDNVVR